LGGFHVVEFRTVCGRCSGGHPPVGWRAFLLISNAAAGRLRLLRRSPSPAPPPIS
jgi:hypothetical protein